MRYPAYGALGQGGWPKQGLKGIDVDRQDNNNYHFAGFTLDVPGRQLLSPGGQPVSLTSRAFDMLLTLLRSQGRLLSKTELMEAVWPGVIVDENNVNQAIFSLRKALGDNRADSRIIRTVAGKGYSFVAPVDVVPRQQPPTGPAAGQPANVPTTGGVSALEEVHAGGQSRRPWHTGWRGLSLLAGISGIALIVSVFMRGSPEASGAIRSTQPTAEAASREEDSRPALLDNSIAVFPFSVLNATTQDDEFFAIGLNDELVSQLSRINSLNIVSRRSTQVLLDQALEVEEVAHRLGVESVLTGTVMFLESQTRVNLQLLDPRKNVTLWSDSYDTDFADLADLVAVQGDIALNAARALKASVGRSEEQALTELPTESFAAYRYNLAARHAYYSGNFRQAWRLGKQAIGLDADYYDALFNFASVNTVLLGMPFPDMTSREHYVLAMDAARQMIRLAPDRTEGYALKAAIHSTNREWDAVTREMNALQSLGATPADMRFLGSVLLCLGDFEGAIRILESNLRVEPVDLYARGFLMMAYELSGNRFRARQEYELGEELSSDWWGDSVNIFLAMGRNESLPDVDQVQGISDAFRSVLHDLNQGRQAAVIDALTDFVDNEARGGVESLFYSAVAAHVGATEESLTLLTMAVEDVWLRVHWAWLPVYDEVRKHPGFRQLMVESGLVAYWQEHGWPRMCSPAGDAFSCDWSAYR